MAENGSCTDTQDVAEIGTAVDYFKVNGRNGVRDSQRNGKCCSHLCIHEAITTRCRQAPNNEAICAWDATWTYEKLEGLSSTLANKLIASGVGPESLVPFCFEKSAWAVVAILAILKAGGAFIPLDPDHPVDRLRKITHESKADIVISSVQNETLCLELTENVLVVDGSLVSEPSLKNQIQSRTGPENAAYVIFTSGSTGEPKGCIIEHQAFYSCALAHGPAHRIGASSRVLQFASYSFDASLVEILTTLIFGGVVCIPSAEARLNDLACFMNDAHVNLAILTPSVASLLRPEDVPLLETLVLVGEPIKKSHVSLWSAIPHLLCAYGPTETAVSATVNPQLQVDSPANIGIPVGCRVQIVDPENHNKPTVPGEVGELLIVGSNLARGYLNDPVKTAASFVQLDGERAYKTGDLVRQNSNGSLEFVARRDTQIKINGQRVELGEIEECIQNSGLEVTAIVLSPKDGLHKRRLVAVVRFESLSKPMANEEAKSKMLQATALSGIQPALSAVKEHLARSLPTFMIPSLIIPVREIPLLGSGKVDRNGVGRWVEALSETEIADLDPTTYLGDEDPRRWSDIERLLVDVWSEVLNIPPERIDRDQTFISLGGDSISAMQIRALCREKGLTISVHEILRFSSIAKIAPHVRRSVSTEVRLEPDDGQPFNLSPIQRMFFGTASYGENQFNQSFLLESGELIDPDRVGAALGILVSRHDMLRARFHVNEAGRWMQSVSPDVLGSYQFTYCPVSTREGVDTMIEESQGKLDIRNGPVVIFQLFHLQQNSFLSVTAHHAIFDLVSFRVILREFETVITMPNYRFQQPTLPFCQWLNLQDSFCEAHPASRNSSYPSSSASSLLFWSMRGQPNIHADKVEKTFLLDNRSSVFLLREGPRVARTDTNDLLLASLIYSFAKNFTDRSTPAVYLEGHGRETWDTSIDISETVGWFTTLYPFSVEIEAEHDIVDVIRHTKDTRRSIRNGATHFSSRFPNVTGGDDSTLDDPMEIVFNFSGSYQQLERDDALFRLTPWSTYESVAGRMERFSLFEISVDVSHDRLACTFTWNSRMAHQARISEWVDSFHRCLTGLSSEISSAQKHIYSPSDFPHVALDHRATDDLVTRIFPELNIDLERDVEDIYPCTPLQKGILLSQAKRPELYVTETVWMVEVAPGTRAIDVSRIASSWEAVVMRHSALRTTFIEQNAVEDVFLQAILKVPQIPIRYKTWEGPGPPRAGEADDAVTRKPGRLLHDFTIFQGEGSKVFCSLKISHALMDGLSVDNIVHDTLQAYDGTLPKYPPMMFEDYIKFVQAQPKTPSLQHWKARLYGIEPCHLPTLSRREPGRRHLKPQALRSVIAGDDAACLWDFCESHGITMSTLVHLGWSLVLQAFTGSNDVLFGYPVSGRDLPIQGIAAAVGAFANLIVCRVKLDPTSTTTDVLSSLQSHMTIDREHQFLSLGDIQHALEMPQPMFNSILSYQKHELSRVATKSSIEFEKIGEWDPSEYDLALGLHEFDKRLFLKLDYLPHMWSAEHASQIFDSFRSALQSLAQSPTQSLSSINLLSPSVRGKIVDFAGPQVPRVGDTIHAAFVARSRAREDEPAVDAWDARWNYGQLLDLCHALAQDLNSAGVSAGTVVPLCFERSAWTVVAILGVLMAGGTFVLLDASQPIARLRAILDQISSRLIVSSRNHEQLGKHLSEDVYVLDPDRLLQGKVRSLCSSGRGEVDPADPAFIIFTSGSTGEPKGVVLSHSAFVSAAQAHSGPLKLFRTSRVLQFASYSFDACLLEILTTLLVGGVVCIPAESDRSSNLAQVVGAMKITWANLTPLVADILLEDDLPLLQTIVVAGEAMSPESISRWRQRSTHVINGYGPTETCIAATLNPSFVELQDTSNIGRPVGCRSWVVNEHHQPVPVGAVGELLLEGPTLATGYLGDVERTDAAFIKSPIWLPTPSGRVYKTGDLVRYELDGSIVFLGRKDGSQVKIRGQRVELDAVQHEINKRVSPRFQCLVEFTPVAKLRRSALVAFLVENERSNDHGTCRFEGDEKLSRDFENLREAVRSSMPVYMVPELYIPLTNIPLMPSGKLNRRLLHEMVKDLKSPQLRSYFLTHKSEAFDAPSSPMENTVAEMWTRLLKIEREDISRDSNFFHIGADSVTAMKLTSLAQNRGLSLTVAQVFAHPRLSQLADILEVSHSGRGAFLEDIAPFSLLGDDDDLHETIDAASKQCNASCSQIQDIYPCSSQQESLFAASIRYPGTYVTKHTVRLPRDIDVVRFKESCEAVYTRVDILRTRMILYQNRILQAVIVERLPWSVDEESSHRSSLSEFGGRLNNFALETHEGDGSPTIFTLTMNHAVYDGWFLRMIFRDIELLYRNTSQPSPRQYKNFIAYAARSRKSDEETYWRETLRDIAPSEFPKTDATAPYELQTIHGFRCEVSSILDITKSVMIRTAWTLTTAHLVGSDDVVFGAVLSGRNAPLTSTMDIAGPMVTTVPICVRVDRTRPVSELLNHMQKQAAEMIAYEHTGLQKIRKLPVSEAATNFSSLVVVQSADSSIEKLGFLGGQIIPDETANLDVYPLVLEFAPRGASSMDVTARHDPKVITRSEMERTMSVLQDTVLQLCDHRTETSVGDIMSYLELYHASDQSHLRPVDIDPLVETRGVDPAKRSPAQTSTQKQLQELWATVLEIPSDRIGFGSNFFHLGGDSITAIKLTMAARSRKLGLPVATVFSHPVLVDMAALVRPLEESRRERPEPDAFSLLTIPKDESLDSVLQSCAAQCRIEPGEIEDMYPTTPLQEGLLALSQKQPGAYVAQHIWRVPDSLDRVAFAKAWEAVSLRHGILRTRIVVHGSQMTQVLVKSSVRVEQSAVPDSLEASQRVAFAPGLGDPLARFLLMVGEQGHTHFLFLAHHAVFDAWSLPLLFKDVERLCTNQAVGSPTPFKSFVRHVVTSDTESSREFWRGYFDALDVVHFPDPLPEAYSAETTVQKASLQMELRHGLHPRITTATLLRAAWSLTLGHYANTEDVVFWSTLSGRDTDLVGVTEVDGPTLATVPTRLKAKRNQSISHFLTSTQDDLKAIAPFQHYGIQNIRQVSDDASKACEATSHLMIQINNDSNADWPDLEQVESRLSSYTSYPLALDCRINGDKVTIAAHFNPELMSKAETERVLEHFSHATAQLSERRPDSLLGDIAQMSPADTETLKTWNSRVPKTVHKTVHQIVHDRANENADRPAVCAWDAEWTHGQLDQISSRLALQLRDAGVKSGSIVPVCFERSAWMVVAMLAVLKAGGAFLPWDPSHPEERRKEMVRQIDCSIILTSRSKAELCSVLADTLVVVDPAALECTDRPGMEPTAFHHDCTSPAYLIYTSGSTGKPKGVVITHEAYSSSGLEHGPVHHIGPTSRVLQFASYSVDAICLEILTTLMMGGCTCIPSSDDRDNHLQQALRAMEVTILALTPSVLSVLDPEQLPSLKTCIMVGEPAPTALVERWSPCAHLINGYGPTETSLAAVMNQEMTVKTGANIGRAVGCATWIADPEDHERLVPIGAVGELLIEGPTLARGYLHDRAKTEAAFILNPAWLGKPGERLYKTGDLVKYADDGTIVFVGRKDSQIKVNGQRVELREIEHHVKKNMAAVDQVVVEASRSGDGRARTLVAFLTVKDEFRDRLGVTPEADRPYTPTSPALEVELKALTRALVPFLPSYMMPKMWVPLNTIPVATSGKVDRKKLGDLANLVVKETRPEHFLASSASTCAPETPMGLLLQDLWAQVLHVPSQDISADDSFFRVGGDSISAMKLAGLAHGRKLRLSVQLIFEYPVLKDMAEQMGARGVQGEILPPSPAPLAFSMVGGDRDVVTKHVQHNLADNGLLIEDVFPLSDFQAWAVGFGILRPNGFVTYMILTPSTPFDRPRLSDAVRLTISAIPILRTGFFVADGRLLQVVFRNFSPKLEHHRSDAEDLESARTQWLQEDSRRDLPMPLPPTQFTLLSDASEENQCLILRLSHAQYDGVSFPKVWHALHRAYSAIPLSPQPSYSAFIEATRRLSRSDEALTYWRTLLRGSSMTPFTSSKRPSYSRPLIKTSTHTIPWITGHHTQNFTQATMVKAAWTLILSHLNRSEPKPVPTPVLPSSIDLTFGSLVSGRAAESIPNKDLIGPYLNIVPVRVVLDGKATLRDLATLIQDQQTASLPYENVGFRSIVRECTDWPGHTRFSSVVQHQNLPEITDHVAVGDISCHSGAWRDPVDSSDVVVLSTPVRGQDLGEGAPRLRLEIGYCGEVMSDRQADALVCCLGRLVQVITSENSDHMQLGEILSRADLFVGVPTHPYRIPEIEKLTNGHFGTPRQESEAETEIDRIEEELIELWQQVFDRGGGQIARDADFSSHPGGDFVTTCILTESLRQRGYTGVSVAKMLEKETIIEQARLLAGIRIQNGNGV